MTRTNGDSYIESWKYDKRKSEGVLKLANGNHLKSHFKMKRCMAKESLV